MASSGKKGKKKGTVISLQSFLANGDVPAGTTQVTKKVRNIEGEESDDGMTTMPLVFQLPTEPRANRIFDDDSVPHNPPYIAYLTNLPFDANEEDLHEFFGTTPIISLRLPREEGENGRVRGFGYVEFENRADFINTLSLPDPSVKGRRIRIELSNENENQGFRQRGNRRGFEGFNNSGENRDSTNWRRENNVNNSNDNYERNFSRERKYESDDKKGFGSWRTGTQNLGLKPRNDDTERAKINDYKKDDQELERPKLNLKPRTLPLPTVNQNSESVEEVQVEKKILLKPTGVPSQNVFGSAKPVDTATRELEIEERMSEARRQQQLKHENDQSIINVKIGDIQLEKTNKDNTNYTTSWRRKNDPLQISSDHIPAHSPERFETQKTDNHRSDKDGSRQIKNRDFSEHVDKRILPTGDGKLRDENNSKKFTKNERTIPKHENVNELVPQTSNKYSGLQDDSSD